MDISQEQFNSLATKDDLKGFATKDDLNQVDNKVNRVLVELLATKDDVNILKENMATKEDINTVLTAIDSVMKKYQDVADEQVSNLTAHDSFDKRITHIEIQPQITPSA